MRFLLLWSLLAVSFSAAGELKLAWDDNSTNEAGFKIERSLSSSSGFVQIATTAANVTAFTDTGLSAGVTYYYRVRAWNSGGNSAYTNVASGTTLPPPPTAPGSLQVESPTPIVTLTLATGSSITVSAVLQEPVRKGNAKAENTIYLLPQDELLIAAVTK
jgi:fibronectin type 3 domain-containing protein